MRDFLRQHPTGGCGFKDGSLVQLLMTALKVFGFPYLMIFFYAIGLLTGGVLDGEKNPDGRPQPSVAVYLAAPPGLFVPLLVLLFPPLAYIMWRNLGRKRLYLDFMGSIAGLAFIAAMMYCFRNRWKEARAAEKIRKSCRRLTRHPLSMREFTARHRCGEERSIERSMQLLAAANKTFSSRDITQFLIAWSFAYPSMNSMLYRIQIINMTVYSVPWSGATPQPKPLWGLPSYEPRLTWVLDDVLELTRRVHVPDVDFLIWLGDDWNESTLPTDLAPQHGSRQYGPIFVQEARKGLDVIFAPPRSLRGCPDFADVAGKDNVLRWDDKIPKAFFRGSPTGAFFDVPGWREAPRAVAVLLSKQYPDLVDAAFTDLNIQTSEAARKEMAELGLKGARMEKSEQLKYKLILNLDGNSVADRFPEQLAGNSVIMKQESSHVEFWYDDLVPHTHYIPLKRDLSDLIPVINRSLNTAEGQAELRHVLNAGSEFVLGRLSPDVCWCYWATLINRYARHMGRVTLMEGSEPWM